MRTLSLCLVGTSPLLLHHISRHQLRDDIACRIDGDMSLEDKARDVMSKDAYGNPVVPVSWISDAISVACSRIVVEGEQVSFFKLQSLIKLPEGQIPLKDTDNRVPIFQVYSSVQHLAPGAKRFISV